MPTLVRMMGHVNNTPSERLSAHVWLVTTEIRVKMVSSYETNELGWSASICTCVTEYDGDTCQRVYCNGQMF